MMHTFSNLYRNQIFSSIAEKQADIVVIGGGITGCGIALDAAQRGFDVVLLEKQDFSAGTSSRSTKLVHGGLRYLKQFALGLVAHVGKERKTVYRNAAHIVFPEKMLLPIIKNGSLNRFTTFLALTLYDFLAGVKREEKKKMLSRKETLVKEKLLRDDIVKGGALYYEYKSDDSRLTMETAKKAVELGAQLINYTEVTSFVYKNGELNGCEILDKLTGKTATIAARYVVNATGVWVDKLRRMDNSLKGKRLHITKGVHLVMPSEKIPVKQSVYFDTQDGRMVFVIPKADNVYIGTTDTDYKDNYEKPQVNKADAEYLLHAINYIFPSVDLKLHDIEASWAGLRPLIHEDGKSPSQLSRKDEVLISDSGLISIAGGKLTGYRLMAKKIVDRIAREPKNGTMPTCQTETTPLAGGDFPFEPNTLKIIEFADHKYDEAKQTGISTTVFKKLFYRYGTNIDAITNKAYHFYNETKNTQLAWIKAEVWYAVHHEMVASLMDFFMRRTGMLLFDKAKVMKLVPTVANEMQQYFAWDAATKQKYIDELMQEFKAVETF